MHTIPGAMAELQRLYAEGERAIGEGRLDAAVDLFTRGLAIDDHFRQRYVTMYAQRAFALHRMGRLEDAIADYGRALAMGEPPPNQAQYHFQRAMCLSALEGREEDAVADFTRSIELYPDHPGPWHLRGKLLVDRLGRYEEGIADLDRLLSMREVPECYQLRALAKVSLGRHAEAIADAQRAEALEPAPYNHYLLAVSFAAVGDEASAQHHVEVTLASAPGFAEYFRTVSELEPYRSRPWFAAMLG